MSTHDSMNAPAPIVACATRGGQGSRAAQLGAIERAKKENARLTFVYVVDDSLFEDIDETTRIALRLEMYWLAQSLLRMATKRARLLGVSAEIVILEGPLRQQLYAWIRDNKPLALVLGAPRGTTVNHFGDDEVEKFAIEIEGETGISVQLVRPDDLKSMADIQV